MKPFDLNTIDLTQYVFFTGKGGVGKTTIACASAVRLAQAGEKVLLISTDPASNLQDVFEMELSNHAQAVKELPNLYVANFDPETAAEEYKEKVVGPYRGILPDAAIVNMEEQLSGSCTTEVAAFNEFAHALTDEKTNQFFDRIIFDTAPTGHTLRMLSLPSAWNTYMDENTTGTSCMGQLSGLAEEREMYKKAVDTLSQEDKTSLILVSRPQKVALEEAHRASIELEGLDVSNQLLVLNGVIDQPSDDLSQAWYDQQQRDLMMMSDHLKTFDTYTIPLKSYNVTGLDQLATFFDAEDQVDQSLVTSSNDCPTIDDIVDDLVATDKKIIFTMGKGGVGKTSVAVEIAQKLAERDLPVHLATTDPANHLDFYLSEEDHFPVSHIDEDQVLQDYQEEVLGKARQSMSEDDLAYVMEDLKSPCTQEIAVFRAFAEIVDQAQDEIIVIDTAPTGHTILLLDSTQSYAQEMERSAGEVTPEVERLLPRLQNEAETEVVMVTLAEATPFYESKRLSEDLDRAGIAHTWWLVNQSLYQEEISHPVLAQRAKNEKEWLDQVDQISDGHIAVKSWQEDLVQRHDPVV